MEENDRPKGLRRSGGSADAVDTSVPTLALPRRRFGKVRRWFRRPPGIGGKVLLDFLRWPITVAGVVALGYVATMVAVAIWAELTLEIAFSAGQVFTGLAGIGAAVIAVAGIAKQLKPQQARFTVAVIPFADDSPLHNLVIISNVGNAPAHNVRVGLLGTEVRDFEPSFPWTREGPPAAIPLTRLLFDGDFVPGTETLSIPGVVSLVSVAATGAAEATWFGAPGLKPQDVEVDDAAPSLD